MNRRFWLYLFGRTISALGDGLGVIAMVWLVYDLTGSKLAMGSLYMTSLIPQVVFRLVGAPLVDRFNRFRLMAVLDLILFAAFLAPWLLSATGNLAVWHLFALEFLAGSALALYMPATMAALPSLVDSTQLMRANSLLGACTQAARVTGPVVAGLLIRFFSPESAMLLDGLTFLLSATLLLLLPASLGAVAEQNNRSSYWQDLTAGFTFFRRVPSLLVLTLIYAVSFTSAYAIFTMHVPYAQDHLQAGPEAAGFLQGFWPLGFLSGSLLMGYLGNRPNRRAWMLSGVIGTGVALAGMGLVGPGWLPLALACKMLEGFCFALFNTTYTTAFQTMVPASMRGRASAVQLFLTWSGNPVGAFMGGFLSEQMGIGPTFVLMGALPIMVGLFGFSLPGLREIDGELRPLEA